MKNFINSPTVKYTVNVLMIAIFSGLAISGIFFMEGGEVPGQNRNYSQSRRSHDFAGYSRDENRGASFYNNEGAFKEDRGEGDNPAEGIHQVSGIIWLLLMFVHISQHWTWFKKFFALKQMVQSKLVTVTILLFGLIVLSSFGMWIEIVPDDLFNLKELHGFIGKLLTGLVLIHVIQRAKWYVTINQKLFNKKIAPLTPA
jgi:hypothetical protein